MRKRRISFSITNYIRLQQASWSIAYGHGVCIQSVPAPTLPLDLHAHTEWHCLLLIGQRDGGVHVLKYILLIPFE